MSYTYCSHGLNMLKKKKVEKKNPPGFTKQISITVDMVYD